MTDIIYVLHLEIDNTGMVSDTSYMTEAEAEADLIKFRRANLAEHFETKFETFEDVENFFEGFGGEFSISECTLPTGLLEHLAEAHCLAIQNHPEG